MRQVFAGVLGLGLAATLVASEGTATKYGAGVTLQQATPIAEVLASPDRFVGKTLRVDGVVAAVCENMGCWMQLKDATSDKTVRIKVDDGVIVFPVTAKGKHASAEGVFERVDTKAEAEHHAAMAAEKKDAKPHTETPAAFQLKATGAIVR
jgi:hypothetical protein